MKSGSQLPLFLTGLIRLPQLTFLIPLCTDRVENTVSNCTSIVACVSVAAGRCLRNPRLEMNVVSKPFASNGCFSGSTVLALRNCSTILLDLYCGLRFRSMAASILAVVALRCGGEGDVGTHTHPTALISDRTRRNSLRVFPEDVTNKRHCFRSN
jgi:hypothetical protein